jgi:hypothetical protein
VLKKVPHRHFVFSILKTLRGDFLGAFLPTFVFHRFSTERLSNFWGCAGRTVFFRDLRAGSRSGRFDASRLLKAATRRRTPKGIHQ